MQLVKLFGIVVSFLSFSESHSDLKQRRSSVFSVNGLYETHVKSVRWSFLDIQGARKGSLYCIAQRLEALHRETIAEKQDRGFPPSFWH